MSREAQLSNYLLVNTIVFAGELREKVSHGLKVGAHDKLTALPPRGQWQGEHRESIANTDNHCVHEIHETAWITDYELVLYKKFNIIHNLSSEIYEFAPVLFSLYQISAAIYTGKIICRANITRVNHIGLAETA